MTAILMAGVLMAVVLMVRRPMKTRVLAVLLCVIGASFAGAGRLAAIEIEPHEQAVYEAVIADVLKHAGPDHARHVAIRVPTATGQRPGSTGTPEVDLKKLLDDLEGTTGPLGPSLRAHFIALNRTTHTLSGELKLPVPYVIKEFDLSPRDFWEQFYRTYPGSAGILEFSRVGFDDGFARALVYVEHLHGNRAMSGEYLLLSHGANGWTIEKRMPSWIA
jgi:hypothetical protein